MYIGFNLGTRFNTQYNLYNFHAIFQLDRYEDLAGFSHGYIGDLESVN